MQITSSSDDPKTNHQEVKTHRKKVNEATLGIKNAEKNAENYQSDKISIIVNMGS